MASREYRKQTAAGEVVFSVSYTGCASITANLNGAVVGDSVVPLNKPTEIAGRLHVARCGKIALTPQDVETIESLEGEAQAEWQTSDAGKAHAAYLAKHNRICDRMDDIARRANDWDRGNERKAVSR